MDSRLKAKEDGGQKPWIMAWDTERELARATRIEIDGERERERSNATRAYKDARSCIWEPRTVGGGGGRWWKKHAYLFNYQRYRINSLIERQMAGIVSGWHALYQRNTRCARTRGSLQTGLPPACVFARVYVGAYIHTGPLVSSFLPSDVCTSD